jgi:hypothetical protein
VAGHEKKILRPAGAARTTMAGARDGQSPKNQSAQWLADISVAPHAARKRQSQKGMKRSNLHHGLRGANSSATTLTTDGRDTDVLLAGLGWSF